MTRPITQQSACRSCGEAVWWLTNRKSGKQNIVNVTPAEYGKGNIVPNLPDASCLVVKAGEGTHTSHWATCRDARSWREKVDRERGK